MITVKDNARRLLINSTDRQDSKVLFTITDGTGVIFAEGISLLRQNENRYDSMNSLQPVAAACTASKFVVYVGLYS
jgi:hypothetical protein